MATITPTEIKDRMTNGESFWVSSKKERQSASVTAKVLGLNYHTCRDDRGGFYVLKLTFPKRGKK